MPRIDDDVWRLLGSFGYGMHDFSDLDFVPSGGGIFLPTPMPSPPPPVQAGAMLTNTALPTSGSQVLTDMAQSTQGDIHLSWASQKGFYVHQRVTYLIIGKTLPRGENAILARAQVFSDSAQFQDSASAFRHAMRGPGQTVEQARDLANAFVRQQFDRAWSAPTREDALLEFGIALHTLQDSTSPAHTGFQLWSGHETLGQQLRHVGAELADPGPGSALHRATGAAWQWFQSGQLPQGNLFIFGHD